jgi:hypothetical protein
VLIQRVHVLQLSFDKFQADEQGWVDTIKSVNSGGTVRINTMDWLGQSQYAPQTVFWPSLSSAISEVFKFAFMIPQKKNPQKKVCFHVRFLANP